MAVLHEAQTYPRPGSSLRQQVETITRLKAGWPESEKLRDFAKRFESFDDRPWLEEDFLPVLNQTFPNSKFIYTRDEVPNKDQITLQVNDPSGFQKLADFLDMSSPQDAFPKVNVTPP